MNTNSNNNLFTNTEDNNNSNNNMKTIFNIYSNSRLPKVKHKNLKINTSQNSKGEGPLSSRDKDKEEHSTIPLDDDNNSKNPKILKIYKINRNIENMAMSANKYINSSSVNNIHRNILNNSQKNNGTNIENNLKTYSQIKKKKKKQFD